MEENKPMLESATFRFSQESNCVDGGEGETIEIRCESDLGIDYNKGCFYIIKTEGWAVSDAKDLQDLFDRINKVIQK